VTPEAVVALATGVAILCWPVPSVAERRLSALVASGRLGRTADAGESAGPRPRPDAELFSRPAFAAAVAGMIGAAAALRYGPGIGLASAVVPVVAWRLLRTRALRRRQAARDRALHAALALVCAELAAGSRTDAALRAAAEVSGPFEGAFTAAARAITEASDPAAALVAAHATELRPVTAALEVALRCGAPIADVLGRARSDVADRIATARELASAVSGARASAVMLAALPVLGVAMGVGLGAAPLQVLFGTAAGHALLAVGAVLTGAGVLWTERLISAVEHPP
jgi:tight adherence protein B